MTQTIVSLIMQFSSLYGIDPYVALAVCEYESHFKADAIGDAGELGLFQIMPGNFKKLTKKELIKPEVNIALGIYLLSEAKNTCPHKKDNTWLVCYNLGNDKAKKVKHPTLWPYYKKVENIRKGFMVDLKKNIKVKVKDLYGKGVDGEGVCIGPSVNQHQFKNCYMVLVPEQLVININKERLEVVNED